MGEIGGEIGKERVLGGLLKTGQTTQYGGYLDDGYYEKGLSKLYTTLTLGQYALTTNITLNAKTDAHSNNCVYDQRTKLMWSRYIVGSVGPGSNGKLPWTTNVNGEGIFPFVDAANVAKLGGYDDWRIPNVFELGSLPEFGTNTAVPDSIAFPVWQTSDSFWSSTTRKSLTTQAVWKEYNVAQTSPGLKTNNYFTVLVRGG